MNAQWHLAIANGKVIFYSQGTNGTGTGDLISGNITVNDGKWHYVGASQLGPTYTIYVDGVLDVQKTSGTPVNYDPTVASGIGYDRRTAAFYFVGDIDELAVWYSTLSNMDFLSLYNAGRGYTNAAGEPVIGVPVTIQTMNAEGSFTGVTGPLLIKNAPGKVVQYSGTLPNNSAVDVASFIVSADATNTLFVVTTPDGLRAQDAFASSTSTQ